MSRFHTGTAGALFMLVGLSFTSTVQSDDAIFNDILFDFGTDRFEQAIIGTRAGGVVAGLKGDFVISLAYVGNRLRKGKPIACKPVEVRIGALYDADNNDLALRSREMTLEAWSWMQETFTTNRSPNTDRSTENEDLGLIVAFSVSYKKPSRGCNIVASGLFHPEGNSSAPVPFSVLPSVDRR